MASEIIREKTHAFSERIAVFGHSGKIEQFLLSETYDTGWMAWY